MKKLNIYDENGNIIYELKNGKGMIKEYFENGMVQYEGEYLNGKRHGKGKIYNNKGIIPKKMMINS